MESSVNARVMSYYRHREKPVLMPWIMLLVSCLLKTTDFDVLLLIYVFILCTSILIVKGHLAVNDFLSTKRF